MHFINGKPACLLVTENLSRLHADGERHFYPAFVKAFEPGFSATDWDYGSNYEEAKRQVEAYNAEQGVNSDAASLIVTTAMFPSAPIAMADIFRANGEEYSGDPA